MSQPKTYVEILSGFETWATERLRSGEDHIYITQQMKSWEDATDLETLRLAISNCTKCDLHKTRTNFVFGVGNPNAKVMVIGEAPGAEEDAMSITSAERPRWTCHVEFVVVKIPD